MPPQLAVGDFECLRVAGPGPLHGEDRGAFFVEDEDAVGHRRALPQGDGPHHVDRTMQFDVGRPRGVHAGTCCKCFNCGHAMPRSAIWAIASPDERDVLHGCSPHVAVLSTPPTNPHPPPPAPHSAGPGHPGCPAPPWRRSPGCRCRRRSQRRWPCSRRPYGRPGRPALPAMCTSPQCTMAMMTGAGPRASAVTHGEQALLGPHVGAGRRACCAPKLYDTYHAK